MKRTLSYEARPAAVKDWARQGRSTMFRKMMRLSKAQGRPVYAFPDGSMTLDEDAPAFPIEIASHTYLARLGVGVHGLKSLLGDNFFVYDLAGGELRPVAGAWIARKRGRLRLWPPR